MDGILSQFGLKPLVPQWQKYPSDRISRGLLSPGNLSLNNRPQVVNPDGSISTVRSMSVNFGDGETLIPTVGYGGGILSDDEAVAEYLRSGRHLGKFDTVDNADAYAERLHNQQAEVIQQPTKDDGILSLANPLNAVRRKVAPVLRQWEQERPNVIPGVLAGVLESAPIFEPTVGQAIGGTGRAILGNDLYAGMQHMDADPTQRVDLMGGMLSSPLAYPMVAGVAKADDIASAITESTGADILLRERKPDGYGRQFVALDEIYLPEAQRGQGKGTQAMGMLTDWADDNGVWLQLSADSSIRGAKGSRAADSRLQGFYRRFGFVPNSGRHKDYTLGGPTQTGVMYRQPKQIK